MMTGQRCPLLKNDLFRQRRPQAENVRNWPMEKICGYDFGFVDPPGIQELELRGLWDREARSICLPVGLYISRAVTDLPLL